MEDDGIDDEDEDAEQEYRSEDDQDYEGSPSREDREMSARPDAIALHRGQDAGTGTGLGYPEDPVNQADPLDGLGSFSPIQGS